MRNVLLLAVCLVVGGLVGWLVGTIYRLPFSPDHVTAASGPPTIKQVESLSELVTHRATVSNVLETRLRGYAGSIRVAVLIHGDVLVAIALAQAQYESVDTERRSAVLALPLPQISSPRLNHDRSRIYAITTDGLWQLLPTDTGRAEAVNQALQQAQAVVAQAADEPDLRARAMSDAATLLRCFFSTLGWEVEVRWQAGPAP